MGLNHISKLLCLCVAIGASAGYAQPLSIGRVDGPPIAILDQERLFTESEFGLRLQRELEQASNALAAENRELEAALLAEEQELTDLRATMDPAAFQEVAAEFDQRVEEIRSAQEARLRDINAVADEAQLVFLQLTTPVLEQVLIDRGAAAVLDSRAVIYAIEGTDITEAALDRINTVLGDGGDIPIFDRLTTSAP